MNDIFNKFTFGFLMAQLFPGAVLVLSLTFLVFCVANDQVSSISNTLTVSIDYWLQNAKFHVFFFLISLGAGMTIHGLHWAILGFLEWKYNGKSIGKSFWHNKTILLQIILGPIKLIIEILWFLFSGKNISEIAIEENVPKMNSDKLDHYHSIEDFYLHFSQFYAHMAFSLFTSTVAVGTYIFISGFTWAGAGIFFLSYLFTGLFFIIGRIQLVCLFNAENDILAAQKSRTSLFQKLKK